jgi:AbiV family abortive infection protein
MAPPHRRERRRLPEPEERLAGARLAARNARSLYAVGSRLLRDGFAAPAAPLLATALEEAVKAIVLSPMFAGAAGDEHDELLESVLIGQRLHQARFDFARDWYIGVEPRLGIVFAIIAAMEGLAKLANVKGESILGDAYRETMAALSPTLAKARELRERGLYVDWRDGAWTDPADVSADEVRDFRRFVARYVRAAPKALRYDPVAAKLPVTPPNWPLSPPGKT